MLQDEVGCQALDICASMDEKHEALQASPHGAASLMASMRAVLKKWVPEPSVLQAGSDRQYEAVHGESRPHEGEALAAGGGRVRRWVARAFMVAVIVLFWLVVSIPLLLIAMTDPLL